jgi:hypothetical protein
VYLTTPAACSRSRSTATTAARTSASQDRARATTRLRHGDRLSPDGTRAFVSLQNKHFLVTVPRAGRETWTMRITGRREHVGAREAPVG